MKGLTFDRNIYKGLKLNNTRLLPLPFSVKQICHETQFSRFCKGFWFVPKILLTVHVIWKAVAGLDVDIPWCGDCEGCEQELILPPHYRAVPVWWGRHLTRAMMDYYCHHTAPLPTKYIQFFSAGDQWLIRIIHKNVKYIFQYMPKIFQFFWNIRCGLYIIWSKVGSYIMHLLPDIMVTAMLV